MSKPTSSTWSLRARNRCKPSAPSCASSCTPSTACSKTTSRSTTRASTPYRRELIAIDNEQSIYALFPRPRTSLLLPERPRPLHVLPAFREFLDTRVFAGHPPAGQQSLQMHHRRILGQPELCQQRARRREVVERSQRILHGAQLAQESLAARAPEKGGEIL